MLEVLFEVPFFYPFPLPRSTMSDNWQNVVRETIEQRTLRKAIFSRRRSNAPVPYQKAVLRPVMVGGVTGWQWALRENSREIHRNTSPEETLQQFDEWFPAVFADCHLFTTTAEIVLRKSRGGKVHLKQRLLSEKPAPSPLLQHNRPKKYLLPEGKPCDFLVEIGVMTPAGKVRAAKNRKFRQINRFLELVDDVVAALPQSGTLRIVDFGCGKSYLTFALHHLLTEIHHREIELYGIDRREDVIGECRRVSRLLNCRGLVFSAVDIAAADEVIPAGNIDLVISLHACDTATDAALAQAVQWGAQVILAVPCCQHEIAAAMQGETLRSVTRYGILKERFAALATDALRAELLHQQGYRVQVAEFIAMEHTAKNVLIRAVQRPPRSRAEDRSAAIGELKSLLGLSSFSLECLLQKGVAQGKTTEDEVAQKEIAEGDVS